MRLRLPGRAVSNPASAPVAPARPSLEIERRGGELRHHVGQVRPPSISINLSIHVNWPGRPSEAGHVRQQILNGDFTVPGWCSTSADRTLRVWRGDLNYGTFEPIRLI